MGRLSALTRAFDSSRATESKDFTSTATAARLADASIVAVRIVGRASFASFGSAVAAAIASTFASSFAAIATVVARFMQHFTRKLDQRLDYCLSWNSAWQFPLSVYHPPNLHPL